MTKNQYPDQQKLLKKCGLFPIDVYIQRRRGTLREYLEENRKQLLRTAEKVKPHNNNVKKFCGGIKIILQSVI